MRTDVFTRDILNQHSLGDQHILWYMWWIVRHTIFLIGHRVDGIGTKKRHEIIQRQLLRIVKPFLFKSLSCQGVCKILNTNDRFINAIEKLDIR